MYTAVCMAAVYFYFFFKQKTAYELRISDWSSDVCSSDLLAALAIGLERRYLVDPLPFALGLAEDGANERHISVPRGVRRLGQAGRQQPIDQIGRASCRERVCQDV